MKISVHAAERVVERLAVDPLEARPRLQILLSSALPIDFQEAATLVPLVRRHKNDKYLKFQHPVTQEPVVALVREDTVVTILTQKIYASPLRRRCTRTVPPPLLPNGLRNWERSYSQTY